MIEAKGGTMKIHQNRQNQETGAVSLFVVMFTAMLFAAVTVGFTVLMLSDQQQSTDNDLAQSALDSANAGAEDAKRVLVQYTDCVERQIALPGSNCPSIINAVERSDCNTVNTAMGETAGERLVQTATGDSNLQQAYTCIKITPNTDDYVGKTRTEGDIRLIPIKTEEGASVETVKVQWLAPSDLIVTDPDDADLDHPPKVGTGGQPSTIGLSAKDDWMAASKGTMLRVGSIQYNQGAVNLEEIDRQARAVFLYPEESVAGVASAGPLDLLVDGHQPLTDMEILDNRDPNRPHPSYCRKDSTSGYLCETSFKLPPGDASTARYISIASLYGNTSFRVTLEDAAGNPVKFRNVQPAIDATGRANDVFRRIVSRVESADASEAPYPRAALGSTGDICKHYLITDDPDDYIYQGDSSCSSVSVIDSPEALPATP